MYGQTYMVWSIALVYCNIRQSLLLMLYPTTSSCIVPTLSCSFPRIHVGGKRMGRKHAVNYLKEHANQAAQKTLMFMLSSTSLPSISWLSLPIYMTDALAEKNRLYQSSMPWRIPVPLHGLLKIDFGTAMVKICGKQRALLMDAVRLEILCMPLFFQIS